MDRSLAQISTKSCLRMPSHRADNPRTWFCADSLTSRANPNEISYAWPQVWQVQPLSPLPQQYRLDGNVSLFDPSLEGQLADW